MIILLIFFIVNHVLGQIPPEPAPPPVPVPPVPQIRQWDRKPGIDDWPGIHSSDRTVLGDWLLRGCWSKDPSHTCKNSRETDVEFEGYDGWYNNFARPDLGAIDGTLLRRWPAAYEDGTYLPSGSKRPNPLELSEQLLEGPIGSQSRTGKNALLVFFGQQVVEEILDAQRPACPPEYFNIPIPLNHSYRKKPGHTVLPLLRTRYNQATGLSPNNPRQQINEITPFIDGGLMYGITKQWADRLRTYSNGTMDPDGLLAYSHEGLFPEYNTDRLPLANPPPPFHHAEFVQRHELARISRFFKLGNPRGNENTFLLTYGVLWFRWHNYLARRFRAHHPEWSSERVFNEARKWVIATHQHIVFDEWLPAWLNVTTMTPYKGYDPSVDPQIDQFFQAAAFRFGHTLVTPGVYLRDYGRNGCNYSFPNWGRYAVRTCNAFWRPQDAIKTNYSNEELIDIDRVLMGMSVQLCEEEDHKIVEDLRGNVFGPIEFPRRDLMAVNIQRARDHGLPDFNSARKAYGLPPVTNVDHFQYVSTEIKERLMLLYNNSFNDIDPWVGGILETGDGPGELFQAVIVDQFQRIRDGDRFWFNNTKNGLFTNEEIDRLKELTFYDVIMAVTKMDHNDIPRNPFNVPLRNIYEIAENCVSKLIRSECRIRLSPTTTEPFNCYHLPQLNAENLNEPCVQGYSYNYFSQSEASFILTYAGLVTFLIGTCGGVYLLIQLKQKQEKLLQTQIDDSVRSTLRNENHIDLPLFTVMEWSNHNELLKPVAIVLNTKTKQICVMTHKGNLLRALDLSYNKCKLQIYVISDQPYVFMKSHQDYDLVIKFDSNYLRKTFLNALEQFISTVHVERENISNFTLKAAFKIVVTQEHRQQRLEMFFRVVFAQAFQIQHSREELLKVDAKMAKEIVHTELTLVEFAEALNMSSNAEFVVRMFNLIDKDKNGFISFREFVDLLIIFAEGDELKKAKLLFDMYDVNATGVLSVSEFSDMIKSFLETVQGKIEPSVLQKTIKNMMQSAGLHNKTSLSFEDFKRIIGEDIKKLNYANLGFKGAPEVKGHNFLDSARNTIESIYENPADIKARLQGVSSSKQTNELIDKEQDSVTTIRKEKPGKYTQILRYIEENAKEIFWFSLYTLVLWAIFAERAYYYSVESEHSGLRIIAGYGVTITRGGASAMMFAYSSLLVTMCKNTCTFLRDTVLGLYFPFDAMVEFHKYIAYWALFFTTLHIIGHGFNFYHISTQTADDLTCLFRNYFHPTHELPKFHYWAWQTMTGITGIILTVIMILIYVFAQPFVRKHIYNWFWYTHSLYPVFFIFMVLHGTGRLIQEPFFHYFFLGPVVLFTLDTLVSLSRKKVEIPVIRAHILPSSVVALEFKRPESFEYKSGQWVRIACLGLNPSEYHPFTLTSSPDESNLTLHIRAVGPWTRNLRKIYNNSIMCDKSLPKIHLDGPYGESHQNWYRFEVSVLIGGGIGVTPFASILKDIVFRANIKHKAHCKKVYFIWVSRTQKQFEWLVDILRDLEKVDENQIVSSHIFITQFYQKFDLRTILLYICERHYQKLSDKSLFTNLKAVTHFGRPDFRKFFKSLQSLHQNVCRYLG
uniref:NAD(P)H oxidase (H2O2-forming) n=1 Tax=Photinus pyralis TaxID=7054 RepID=A0A1Y1KGZ7_PHOPY